MSNILNKPYNEAQKILRAIFGSAPSIVTAPDLNRQFAIIEQSISEVQQASFVSGIGGLITFSTENWDGTKGMVDSSGSVVFNGITVGGMVLQVKGCEITIPGATINHTAQLTDKLFVSIFAKQTLVTKDTDTSAHLISGAKFEDGSVLPAAEHYVLSDEEIVISTNAPTNNAPADKVFICAIGRIEMVKGYTGSATLYAVVVSSFINSYDDKQAGISENVLSFPIGKNPYTVVPFDTVKEALHPSESIRKSLWKIARNFEKQTIKDAQQDLALADMVTYTSRIDHFIAVGDEVQGSLDIMVPTVFAIRTKVMLLDGDQTVAGVKTFSQSPIVPTPTTSGQAVNKGYVDTLIAHPILYAGSYALGDINPSPQTVTITFPDLGTTSYIVMVNIKSNRSPINDNDMIYAFGTGVYTQTSFKIKMYDVSNGDVQDLTIEYAILKL